LIRLALATSVNAQPPYVVPRSDGSVHFEWSSPKWELEAEVANSGALTVILSDLTKDDEVVREGQAGVDLLLHWAPRVAQASNNAAHGLSSTVFDAWRVAV
jgi:hypothetical protein